MVQPVAFEEIRNIADYEIERSDWRPQVMALKDRRRVRVGGHLTFLFENHDTVRYQVQEMMRIERIVRERDIRHELETYNELIPAPYGLCASLLIEYDSPEERTVWLRELLGLEDHVWFQAGGLPPVKARFDTRQIASDRISSVQYVKFDLGAERAAALSGGGRLIVDHPRYTASTELTGDALTELVADVRP
ncbi:MAG: DUF3501 family protein [Bryobacteraceae bacterium]